MALCLLLLWVHAVCAQLSLPSTPPATSGAQPSSRTNIPNSQWSILLRNHLYFYEVQRSGRFPWSRYVGETMAPSIVGRTSASICLADTMMPVVHTSSSCLFFSTILKPSLFCIRLHQVHIPSRQSSSLSPHRSILTVSLELFHHVNIRRLGSTDSGEGPHNTVPPI